MSVALAAFLGEVVGRSIDPTVWLPALAMFILCKRWPPVVVAISALVVTIALDIALIWHFRRALDTAHGVIAVSVGSLAFSVLLFSLNEIAHAISGKLKSP